MPPKYPGTIPTLSEIFTVTNYVDWILGEEWHNMRAELRAALVELGTDPAGTFATVKARLDAILPHFTDRGNAVASDWDEDDLTHDNAFHDLDMSGIVPAGATAVLLYALLKDNDTANFIRFKKKGQVNENNAATVRIQVANQYNDANFIVICDSNREVEYKIKIATMDIVRITVRGWWK